MPDISIWRPITVSHSFSLSGIMLFFPCKVGLYPQLNLTCRDLAITLICWEHDDTPDSGITGANDTNNLRLTEIDLGAPNYS